MTRSSTVFLGVVAFFLCCYWRVLAVGYLELDDLGRVQMGYNLWAADGRLLTAGLMGLLSFGGQIVDIAPGPQFGAIALMGAAGVLLARTEPALGPARAILAAILLFATPFYLQNMTYVFDSLSMTAAMVLGLWSALLVAHGSRHLLAAVAALLAALQLYQPAVNVFLCFAAAGVLYRAIRAPASAWPEAGRAVLVLFVACAADMTMILILRATGLVVMPGYQAQHAVLMPPQALLHQVPANIRAMLALAAQMIRPAGLYGALAVLAIAGILVLALRGCRGHGRLLALAAACVLLAGFGGPMLLLANPVVQPRTLLGIGAMLSASVWTMMRLLPAGRQLQAATLLAVALAFCFSRDALAYGALLRDLDRYEASVLPDIAHAVNEEHAKTGLTALQILGAMPYPPVLQHGLRRAPVLIPLFDNPLNGISWFGVALLSQYGLDDGLWFRDAAPASALCPLYRETGASYAVTHDAGSLILMFRGGCP